METAPAYLFNPDGSKEREIMLNNEKYSDITFLVNNSQFHASSHIVCVYSPVLDAMITDHFKSCGDREIKIGLVKEDSSFLILLRYVYGLSINFTDQTKAILCEVLCLSDCYELPGLTNELKKYLSQIQEFQIDSVVVLMNTTKKFCLEELFGKLLTFANNNADQLMSHESFADLQYDVLRDLVKGDNFFTREIDILKGVLTWHDSNMTRKSNEELDEKVSMVKTGTELDNETKLNPDDTVPQEASCSNNKDVLDYETLLSVQNNRLEESLESLSQIILEELLSHIRVNRISFLELLELYSSELGIKYKRLIDNCKSFLLSSEPRKRDVLPVLHNEVKLLDDDHIICPLKLLLDNVDFSKKEYVIGDMKFKIAGKKESLENDMRRLSIFLQCSSDKLNDWECSVQCQVRLNSIIPFITIPGEKTYSSVVLTSKESCVEVGKIYYPLAWRLRFKNNSGLSSFFFDFHFKHISIKIKA